MNEQIEKLYKLTDKDGKTYGGFQWVPGEWVETSGEGGLCSDGLTHWYRSKEEAMLYNVIHGNFEEKSMLLWEGEGVIVIDDGTKVGCKRARILQQVEKPVIPLEKKIECAIRCSLLVYSNDNYKKWADGWLSDKDRTAAAAYAAAHAAYAADAAYAAAHAAYAAYAAADVRQVIKEVFNGTI